MTCPSTRIHVSRRIDADPASTALLLAGPSALDLWPGVHRVEQDGELVLVEALPVTSPGEPASAPAPRSASVTAGPPRRTPTSFVSPFSWSGPELPVTSGQVTLTYAPGSQGVPATYAELDLEATARDDDPVDVRGITSRAERFLANLARVAEARRAA